MLQTVAQRICELQRSYSARNTPEMEERGQLIRHAIPEFLDGYRPMIASELGIFPEDVLIEGRDGTGQKSKVPWVRYSWKKLSPAAHEGWYCVFLFRKEGDGFYLALVHASTIWELGNPRPRPIEEVSALVGWARMLLRVELEADKGIETVINLSSENDLAAAYERSTAIARFYHADAIPTDDVIATDVQRFGRWLGTIYEQVRLGRGPDANIRQAEEVQQTIKRGLGANGTSGQGFGLSANERKAVEHWSMKLARQRLAELGFKGVKDTSATAPYDFEGTFEGKKHIIEVKGTTGTGDVIILTSNEVAAQTAAYPFNCLVIVEGVELERADRSEPQASGGRVRALRGWRIDDGELRPLSFQHKPPVIGWD